MNALFNPLRLPCDDLDSVVKVVGTRWERLASQRLLLTGGTGFIGKWLLGTFLHANRRYDLNARIVIVSRQPELFLNKFPELLNCKEIEWLALDVRHLSHKTTGNREFGFAIHAATDVVASSTPTEILDTCISGTRRVLDVMMCNTSPSRMLLLSSGAVYGRTSQELTAIREEWAGAPDPLSTASSYGEGKRVSELLCSMVAAEHPALGVAIARCFSFVGPHLPLDQQFAIGNFIASAMHGEDIRIQGDGSPMRSYLYVSDLVHWLWVMLFDSPSCRAFNIGGAESISIGALANRVKTVLNADIEIRIEKKISLSAGPNFYVPSIDRIAAELELTPTVSLNEAITRTANWSNQIFKS